VPQRGAYVAKFRTHLRAANQQANPEPLRIALKLATGAGKTTVMAMLIAWQTVNAVRHPQSRQFSRAFLVVTIRKGCACCGPMTRTAISSTGSRRVRLEARTAALHRFLTKRATTG
jgi:hypothetical protein